MLPPEAEVGPQDEDPVREFTVLTPASFATRERTTNFEAVSFKISADWTHLELVEEDESPSESEDEDQTATEHSDDGELNVAQLQQRVAHLRRDLVRRQAKAARRRRRLLTELGSFLDPSPPSVEAMMELWRCTVDIQTKLAKDAGEQQDLTEASIAMLARLNPVKSQPSSTVGLVALTASRRHRVLLLRRELRAHVARCSHNLRAAQLRAAACSEPDTTAAQQRADRDKHLASAALVFAFRERLKVRRAKERSEGCRTQRVFQMLQAEKEQMERSLLAACARDSSRVIATSQYLLRMHKLLEQRQHITGDREGESRLSRAAKVRQRQQWCSSLRTMIADRLDSLKQATLDERTDMLKDQLQTLGINVEQSILHSARTAHEGMAKAAHRLWEEVVQQQQLVAQLRERALDLRLLATSTRLRRLFDAARQQARAWPEAVTGHDSEGGVWDLHEVAGEASVHEAGRRLQTKVFALWNEFGADPSEQLGFLQHALSLVQPETPEATALLRAEVARLRQSFTAVQLLGELHAATALHDRLRTKLPPVDAPASTAAEASDLDLELVLTSMHYAALKSKLSLLDVASHYDEFDKTRAALRPPEHVWQDHHVPKMTMYQRS